MRLILLTTLILVPQLSLSQPLQKKLIQYFSDIRLKSAQAIPAEVHHKSHDREIYTLILSYMTDPSAEVRKASAEIMAIVGYESMHEDLRRQAVLKLLLTSDDTNQSVRATVSHSLRKFHKTDFSEQAKDTVRSFLRARTANYSFIVMLAGYLQLTDQVSFIRSQLRSGTVKSPADAWSALLALSRMGDQEALRHVMDRAVTLERNESAFNNIFPDLVYTRQRRAIDYLIEMVSSEALLFDDYEEEVICMTRALELLAPVIKDFPLRRNGSGKLMVTNFNHAIHQAREWLARKSNNYEIIEADF